MISIYQKLAGFASLLVFVLFAGSATADNSKLIEWKTLSDPTGIIVDQALFEKPEIRGQAQAVEGTGVMKLNGGSMVMGLRDEEAFRNLLTENDEFTIEVTVLPFSALQSGPARILSYSTDHGSRNFTIGQEGDQFDLRLRTTATDENGHLPDSTFGKAEAGVESTITVSYKPERLLIAVNGKVVVDRKDVKGELKNWTAHSLVLGDELSGGRVWRGEIRGISIYNRARNLRPGTKKQTGRPARDPNQELKQTRRAVDELKKKVAEMREERKEMELRIEAGDRAGAELDRQLARALENHGGHPDLERQLAEAREFAKREHDYAERISEQVLEQVKAQQAIAIELRETIALIQRERAQLLDRIENQKPTTDPQQLKNLTAENEQLSSKLKDAWERAKQQEALEADLKSAKNTLQMERSRLEKLTTDLAKARGTIDSLQNELKHEKTKSAQLEKQGAALQKFADDLSIESKQAIEQLEEHKQGLKTKFEALAKSHKTALDGRKKADAKITELEKQHAALQQEMAMRSQNHKAQAEQQTANMAGLLAESKKISADRDRATAERDAANTGLKRCEERSKALGVELEKSAAATASAETRSSQLDAQLEEITAKNKQLQAQLTAKTAEASNADAKAVTHRAEALRERILRNKLETQIEDAAAKVQAEAAAEQRRIADERAKLLSIAPIYFGKNKADSDAQEKSLVAQVTQIHSKYPEIRFSVTGHTCTDGTAEANLSLSQRRAQRIADLLMKNGIPTDSITEVTGKGQTEPSADNATQEGREANRRVEVKPIED